MRSLSENATLRTLAARQHDDYVAQVRAEIREAVLAGIEAGLRAHQRPPGARKVSLGCRKQGHRTRALALAQIRSIVKRGSDWYDPKHLSVYRCVVCGWFHVGHTAKQRPTVT